MQHLDEGTVHGWLDGQLPPEEAKTVEAHIAECRQCADAVAEARGLIAASSRIMMALDNVPAEVIPKPTSSQEGVEAPVTVAAPVRRRAEQRAERRWFNGASLAAAAAIVLAIGTATVLRVGRHEARDLLSERTANEATIPGPSSDSSASIARPQAASTVPAPPVASPAPPAAKTLGGAVPGSGPQRLAASDQPFRDSRQEAAQSIAGQRARESNEKASQQQGAVGGASQAPAVAQAKVVRPIDELERQKTADQLSKDKKAENAAPPTAATVTADRLALRGAAVLRLDSSANKPVTDVGAALPAGSIRGRVTDANNTGLANVVVEVAGTSTGVTTNDNGEFTLGGIPAGARQLVVRRIGYERLTRDVTIAAGQTSTADLVLKPAQMALENVVVTGTASRTEGTKQEARRAAKPDAPAPSVTGRVVDGTPASSSAVGCYDVGITSGTTTRTGFRQVPRKLALDAEIVPGTTDGIWYRARDLARTGTVPNGMWRAVSADTVELQWINGKISDRVRLAGQAGSMMRGNVEEIDRATSTGEAGSVVAVRRTCEP